MADNAQEKTESATPRKRRQARQQGTVARSQDLSSALTMFALSLGLPVLGASLAVAMIACVRTGLSFHSESFSTAEVIRATWASGASVLYSIIPVIGLIMIVGLLANFVQVGFHPTAEPLAPKFDRINPINGLKKLFSKQAGFEFFKTLVKFSIIGFITWRETSAHWDELLNLAVLPPSHAVSWLGQFLVAILLKVSVAWVALAAVDYGFQKWMVEKQMMMTKDEVRREMRETETSPELRAEMHRRRQRLMRQRMMSTVKHADAIITNPLEYAIAIKYDTKKMAAPLVVAKGRHLVAERIRDEAKKHRVPIIPNPPLARSLYKEVEVGDPIPTALFKAVAEVLAYVFKLKGKRL